MTLISKPWPEDVSVIVVRIFRLSNSLLFHVLVEYGSARNVSSWIHSAKSRIQRLSVPLVRGEHGQRLLRVPN